MGILTNNWDLWGVATRNTLLLFAGGAALAIALGTVLGVMRVSSVPAARVVSTIYTNTVRNTPLTLVFFFIVFGAPVLGLEHLDFKALAILSIGIYFASYVSEVLRSGFNTVPAGQAEAARALGLQFRQVMGSVILPQAVRAVVPPMTSVLIALLKMTTVAAGFSVLELGAIRAYLSERGENALGVLLWVAAIFLVMSAVLAAIQHWFEKRWSGAR